MGSIYVILPILKNNQSHTEIVIFHKIIELCNHSYLFPPQLLLCSFVLCSFDCHNVRESDGTSVSIDSRLQYSKPVSFSTYKCIRALVHKRRAIVREKRASRVGGVSLHFSVFAVSRTVRHTKFLKSYYNIASQICAYKLCVSRIEGSELRARYLYTD